MFFVFNKEKIYAYLVSVVTVCFLFLIAGSTQTNTVETSTNTNIVVEKKNDNITNNVLNNNVKIWKK